MELNSNVEARISDPASMGQYWTDIWIRNGSYSLIIQLLFTPNEIIWAVRLIAIAVLQSRSH